MPSSCLCLLTSQHTKYTKLTKTLNTQYYGKTEQPWGMSICGHVIWGVQRVASEPPRAPGRYSLSTKISALYQQKKKSTERDSDIYVKNNGHNMPHFARHRASTTRHIKWGSNRVGRKNVRHFNTFAASYLNTQGLNNSCLKSPASTLVDLTFQSRALRSFSLNQLCNLSL